RLGAPDVVGVEWERHKHPGAGLDDGGREMLLVQRRFLSRLPCRQGLARKLVAAGARRQPAFPMPTMLAEWNRNAHPSQRPCENSDRGLDRLRATGPSARQRADMRPISALCRS